MITYRATSSGSTNSAGNWANGGGFAIYADAGNETIVETYATVGNELDLNSTHTVLSNDHYSVYAWSGAGDATVEATVTCAAPVSTDANLSGLVLTGATLSPIFASAETSYTASVPNTTASLTVKPTVNDAGATVTVNGVAVASGTASASIQLNAGENTLTTVVTAEDGTTTKTYTVRVTRAASTNANLSGLALSNGTLSPSFASGTTSYTAAVPNATSSLAITPDVSDATATVTVNGVTVTSGIASGALPLAVGANTLTTIVAAQDGITTKTYTITVTRAEPPSTNANLSGLGLSSGTLTPAFASATTSYAASVPNATTSLTVTPDVSDATATVTVNGVAVTSGAASGAIALAVGANTVTTVVTAEDGTTTKTYTVTVTRAASADANLSSLVMSSGTLSPVFASGTASYTAAVSNSTASLTVRPTASDANATITVNNTTVASGATSGPISLNVGSNTLTIVVTAQDGTTTETYTVTVTRAASSNADLDSMVLSDGALSPSFAAATTSYTASVPNATSSLTVTSVIGHSGATLTVNGDPVASNAASGVISLAVGSNTVTAVVTAEDRTTVKTYTVTVTRAPSANADLSGLSLSAGTLSPVFASGMTSYTATVPNATASLTATPTVSDATATVTVNGAAVASGAASGPITLAVGTNVVTAAVTAQDGTSKTYTVTVTRAPSANADLSSLSLSAGTLSPAFASGTTTYTSSVPNATTSVTVTPDVSDATATIMVNGGVVASGAASSTIALAVGANVVTTVVTAQDGTTVNTYTVTVTRAGSANSDLSGLSLSAGTLSPAFASGTTSYSASVPNATTSLTVTPDVSDTTATVTVNGATVASGVASGSIPLAVGPNALTTVVTAEDGTTKTYTVTVTRAASANADLSGLSLSSGTLSPVFSSGTTAYTASVPNTTASLTVTPTASDATATITVNGTTVASGAASGSIVLAVGTNVVTTVVTAEDGTTQSSYALTVTRAASTNAELSGLTLSGGTLSPAFASATTSYTASVPNAVASLTVTPLVSDATATVTVNGVAVASGAVSGAIALAVGSNTVTTVVTAEDGTTQTSYTVVVTRALPASTDAKLAGLSLSTGTLSPGFSAGVASYTASVSNATASLTVTPTVSDAAATVTVNGVPVASGAASGSIALAIGSNTLATVVTAEDGTVNTYTITVTRAPPAATFTFSPAAGALPSAMAGEKYAQPITATGGSGALLYAVGGGTLPKGMVLNVSTGELTGPLGEDAEVTDYSFTISVTDAAGSTASAAYSLKVTAREVSVADQIVNVPAGSSPPNVYLNGGATGGPFSDAQIVTITPANAGKAEIIEGELAQVGAFAPVGYYLKFTPDPAFSGQAKIGYQLTAAAGPSNVGVITYNLRFDADAVVGEIDSLVRGFVQARQNLLASSIQVPGLLERRRLQAGTDPVTMRLSPSTDGVGMSFATSLAQLEAARNAADGIEGGEVSPFNAWLDATMMLHNRKQNDDRWGGFGLFSAGVDYLINEKALIGFSFHVDHMTDPTADDAEIRGTGWLAGPYTSLELTTGIFFNTSLLYGGSSNDIDTAFFDGSFDSSRWMWDSSITGQWDLDEDTVVTPKLRAVYLNEDVDDYGVHNDAGGEVGLEGFALEQFRVSLGAEIERQFTLENDMTLKPRVGAAAGYSGLDGSGTFGSLLAGVSLQANESWVIDANLRATVEGDGETYVGARLGVGGRF
ncbi:cadherin-like beta sandwich domain-containing protein [Ensifer sp. 4252]|uniref:cadherin-like beta sandwich domain-containing protein n=1 Tax=Ensifer sp. 4252 TaxID=3373915 RepID=UPI003D19AE49